MAHGFNGNSEKNLPGFGDRAAAATFWNGDGSKINEYSLLASNLLPSIDDLKRYFERDNKCEPNLMVQITDIKLQLDKIKLQVDKIEFALGGHVLLNGKFVPLSKFM
jgi:hypothetical protein